MTTPNNPAATIKHETPTPSATSDALYGSDVIAGTLRALDQAGELDASVAVVRNEERARRLLETRILPAAMAAAATAESSYSAAAAGVCKSKKSLLNS